jgi:alpha-glucosidase
LRQATLISPPVFRLADRSGCRVPLESDTGAIAHIFVLEDDIVRLVVLPDGEMKQPKTWAIAPGEDDVPYEGRERFDTSGFSCPNFALNESADRIEISTKRVRLSIKLNGFFCSWSLATDEGWSEVARDRPTQAYDFGWWDGKVRHYLARDPAEQYYGLGEKTGALDRAGRRFRMAGTDAMGYDAEVSDPLYKHTPFYITRRTDGLCFGLFYDTLSDCVFDMGCERNNYHGLYRTFEADHGDLDLTFIAGPHVADVAERFTWLTGRPAETPDWALRYSGSTMSYTDAPDAQEQMNGFLAKLDEYTIPCSSFHLSSGYSSIGGKRYVFHWNREKFPDPHKFFADYAKAGIRVLPNVKPALLLDHPRYAEAASQGLFLANADGTPALEQFWGAPGSYLDFTNPNTAAWWKENLTRHLLEYGAAAIWNDNNEYDVTNARALANNFGNPIPAHQTKPLQSLLMARASREALREHKPGEIPFVVSRSGMAGMQRYVQTWSGDNYTSWKTLKFNIRMGLGLALSGVSNIGHDIGGFDGPPPDRELFLRWLGFGIFMPRFTIHSWKPDAIATEPWMYPDALDTVRALFSLREELIPHIAEALRDYRDTYKPAVRPLFYDFPDDPNAWHDTDQFLLGRSILVAPVVEEGATSARVYLPAGADWKNRWTGTVHKGAQVLDCEAPLDQPPFFLRTA